ncbi:hypothetical protein SAMN05192564_102298 [Paraburkholderia sartisoli]|uniref:Uncharacterized protein n=1 Tax=Paraburkholderia sartisoli TaxID=83784 RepID=A0A1H4CFZ5_9BURK|nr:hypothetical protein SAMN05192564_102298 [Paraburkholderia sartisoli]
MHGYALTRRVFASLAIASAVAVASMPSTALAQAQTPAVAKPGSGNPERQVEVSRGEACELSNYHEVCLGWAGLYA